MTLHAASTVQKKALAATCVSRAAFVAVYEVPGKLADDIPLEELPGLCSVDIVANIVSLRERVGATQGIYTTWKSEADFLLRAQDFLSLLQRTSPAAELVWHGWRRAQVNAEPRAWHWLQWGDAGWTKFAWLVAAIGLVNAFVNYCHDFFEAPDIREVSPADTIDVLEGEAWKAEFQLQNTARHVDSVITVRHGWLKRDGSVQKTPITDVERTYLPVKSGLKESYTLQRPSDAARATSLLDPPGSYTVGIDVDAEGGYFRWNQQRSFTRPLRIWKAHDFGPPVVSTSAEGPTKSARVEVPLLIGRAYPDGIRCQATLVGCTIDELLTRNMPLATAPEPENNPAEDGTGTAVWECDSVGPTRRYSIVLVLSHDPPLTNNDWKRLVGNSRLRVDISPRSKK